MKRYHSSKNHNDLDANCVHVEENQLLSAIQLPKNCSLQTENINSDEMFAQRRQMIVFNPTSVLLIFGIIWLILSSIVTASLFMAGIFDFSDGFSISSDSFLTLCCFSPFVLIGILLTFIGIKQKSRRTTILLSTNQIEFRVKKQQFIANRAPNAISISAQKTAIIINNQETWDLYIEDNSSSVKLKLAQTLYREEAACWIKMLKSLLSAQI